ncbi:hypothetical protein [Rhodococcus sp. 14-2470-1a]|uniref:hypothetical protein n=1 Tax=Rhodococcus sp. 14-2470-1a TaxID=2023150 RepID=UPI000B9A1B91|nr:hypothetical protein [Rhodococcus sp. 14-2470-1a]OZF42602.1 hypothetical protein CH292_25550 [Rhodococcus sp. 14-2470-1a]
MWQDAQPGPFLLDHYQRVLAGQPDIAVSDQRKSFSVPRLVEINEAFAVQVIGAARELGIDEDTLNVSAVRSPSVTRSMTGARITATLLNNLTTHDMQFGLETMCVGGGQGMAMVLERLSRRRHTGAPPQAELVEQRVHPRRARTDNVLGGIGQDSPCARTSECTFRKDLRGIAL